MDRFRATTVAATTVLLTVSSTVGAEVSHADSRKPAVTDCIDIPRGVHGFIPGNRMARCTFFPEGATERYGAVQARSNTIDTCDVEPGSATINETVRVSNSVTYSKASTDGWHSEVSVGGTLAGILDVGVQGGYNSSTATSWTNATVDEHSFSVNVDGGVKVHYVYRPLVVRTTGELVLRYEHGHGPAIERRLPMTTETPVLSQGKPVGAYKIMNEGCH
ncbi:hypothetical protein [Streptomyces sp. NPDC086835]|uniref:hypothetical protein n=1 Tax=Streptomyces sp. NPDC086835 TaxID=3365761 RepID=UPI00380012E5